jgi:hypothetical protein
VGLLAQDNFQGLALVLRLQISLVGAHLVGPSYVSNVSRIRFMQVGPKTLKFIPLLLFLHFPELKFQLPSKGKVVPVLNYLSSTP